MNASASGSESGSNPANSAGSAIITVYYEIFGPASVSVPLIISASASTSASGGNTTAHGYVYYAGGSLLTCSSTVANECNDTAGASGSLNGVIFTNSVSNALYDVEVQVTGSSSGGGTWSGQVSNISLGIDPTWLQSNPGYTLVFSSNSNISQTANNDTDGPIPLWALGALGAGLVGIAARQRPVRALDGARSGK